MTFHPQTDGQIDIVKRMIIQTPCMYNLKHPCTWDKSLPYVQHSYNKALQSSPGNSSFHVGLGLQPLYPIDVAIQFVATHVDLAHVQDDNDNANNFIEHIQQIFQQVHDILDLANAKYKQCHDQYRDLNRFELGDKVWLHL